MTGYELLWLIYLYSFFGWCLEVCLATFRRKTFVNRGILNAPFCMLYGFSASRAERASCFSVSGRRGTGQLSGILVRADH